MTTRRALVGGGASGIGLASARALAGAGHEVVLTGRDRAALEEAAGKLTAETGVPAHARVADLSDPAAAPVEAVERELGPVDVLLVNAGGPPPGRVLSVDDDAWRAGAELLLLGPLRLARAALPRMAARGFGRVVVVTSTAVRRPEPDLAVSVVLRSAVTAAAKLLSREHAHQGVTVNCVAPGATATARREAVLAARAQALGVDVAQLEEAEAATVPAGRPARPEEVAAAVAFLASDAAGYVNGTTLTVDGGRTEAVW